MMTKKERAANIAALILNITIVFLTFFAVGDHFRSDVVPGENDLLIVHGTEIFRFFTVLSNMLVAVASVVSIVCNVKIAVNDSYKMPKWAYLLKYAGTVAVTVTFLTVVVFLGPLVAAGGRSYFDLFAKHNFILHFLTPVLAIVTFLFLEKTSDFKFRYTIFGALPVVVYSLLYMPMVLTGTWNDFYSFTFGGKMWAVPISLIVMYGFSYGLAVAERATSVKVSGRRKK